MNALFLADSFGKSFGENTVLTAATAWASPGRVTVILGRNGSGKTTLLRSALGLCRPDWGVVHFDGRTYRRPSLWRMAARGLFFLPDRGLLSRRMSFGDQLAMIAGRFGVRDVGTVAERLGVDHMLASYPDRMSGGERRRAELSLAVARGARCLIADEPLTEVEPKDRQMVCRVLREQADAGAAVLVTGHEVRDLLDLADEVIWMASGTTHGLGSPAEARGHDQFRREYLGPNGG